MRWTQEQLNAYESRLFKPQPHACPCDRESDLHAQILAECKRRLWPVFHSRMDKPATVNIGSPDFVIAAEGGRTLYFECKAKGGKLSTAQQALRAAMARVGHTVYTVYSFDEFLGVLRDLNYL